MDSSLFLRSGQPLHFSDAVAAILVVEDGRYVMQLRDDLPHIFYPGHWGCFGGAVEAGERQGDALAREIREELSLTVDPARARQFTRFDFHLSWLGDARVYRTYYEVRISDSELGSAVLGEGAAFRAFSAEEILRQGNLVPYDAFALWMHSRQNSLSGPGVA